MNLKGEYFVFVVYVKLLVFPPRKCIEMVAVVEYCNNFKPSKAFSKKDLGLGCFVGDFIYYFVGIFFFLGGGWGLWCVCVWGGGGLCDGGVVVYY